MSLDSRSSVLAQGVEKVALFFVEPETEGAADLFIEASLGSRPLNHVLDYNNN